MNKKRYTLPMQEDIIRLTKIGYSRGEVAKKLSDIYHIEVTKNMISGKIDRMRKSGIRIDDKINSLPPNVNV